MPLRVFAPTPSYEVTLPDDVQEDVDGRVVSYWRPGSTVALQLSSYRRDAGPQVTSRERMRARLQREALEGAVEVETGPTGCPDVLAIQGKDETGAHWIHCYAVWPDLTVLASTSWVDDRDDLRWALDGIASIRRTSGSTQPAGAS